MANETLLKIEKRFNFNLARVNSLVDQYKDRKQNDKDSKYPKDILRAATVLLHASLEDLLREVIRTKATIPLTDKLYEYLDLQFGASGREGKLYRHVTVQELVETYADKTVREILDEAIQSSLQRNSFSSSSRVAAAVSTIGLNNREFNSHYRNIEQLASRRHKIVHESDRELHDAESHGKTRDIRVTDLTRWTAAVSSFGLHLIAKLKEGSGSSRARQRRD